MSFGCDQEPGIVTLYAQIITMTYPTYISRTRVIANDVLQADMLAKAGSLKTLEQNISHAEVFEIAKWDQNEISGVSDIAGL